MNWSNEQLSVIHSRTNNTLVSASAGSGKTTVMIERLMRIVTGDYFESEPTPIKRVVVVTFNNSVAQELRLKIAKKLKEIMAQGEHISYLREQIEDIPMSDISTLHALCGNLIRQNFEVIGVDPAFGILDDEGQKMMFDKALDATLKEYQSNYNGDFEILYKYCGGFKFAETIKKFYSFVVAQRDRERFLNEIAYRCCTNDLDSNELVTRFVFNQNEEITRLVDIYSQQVQALTQHGMDGLANHASDVLNQLQTIGHFEKFSDMLNALPSAFAVDRCPSVRDKDDLVQQLKNEYQKLNNATKAYMETLINLKSKSYEEYCSVSDDSAKYVSILCEFTTSVMGKFQELKLQENKMDFNDLEYYAVKILENEDIAVSIRDKYDYVCVDEYQDINAVQEYILTRISKENNLFMVGDSKQSIYGFRQTDTSIFLNKFDEYIADDTKGSPFYLNANYRSSQDILQFVNLIFDQIMTKDFGGVDYKKTARLECGQKAYVRTVDNPCKVAIFSKSDNNGENSVRKVNDKSMPVTGEEENDSKDILDEDGIYSVRNHPMQKLGQLVDNEAIYIAREISELVGKKYVCEIVDGKPVERLIEYGDIAILFSSRDEKVATIVRTLHDCGIPIDLSIVEKESENISVETIIDFLRVVDNPEQDYALISAMSGFLGGFSFDELADIRAQTTLLDKKPNDTYYFEYVLAIKEVDSPLGHKVKDFFAKLDKYRIEQASFGVSELMKQIVSETHFDDYILMKENGKQEYEQMMLYIRSLKDKNYNASLSDYLKMVTDRQKVSQASAVGEQDCVKLQTMHASKGLEYPIVFVVNASKKFNFDEQKQKFVFDKDYGVSMHGIDTVNNLEISNISMIAMRDYKKYELLQERMRIFYVALTRAKNMLYVTATVNDVNNLKGVTDPRKANSYLDWILYTNGANPAFEREYMHIENIEIAGDTNTSSQLLFRMPSDEKIEELERQLQFEYDFEESKNLCIKHTVTEINNISSQKNQSDFGISVDFVSDKGDKSEIGTALHKAMELVDFALDGESEVKQYLDVMVDNDMMSSSQRQLIDDSLIVNCLNNPIVKLARTHKHYREKEFMLNLPACEVLDVKTDDKILLQGIIDLLIEKDDGYIVVDFKYTRKSDEGVVNTYQKQLDIYALAVEICTGKKVLGKYIVVIGDNRIVEIK